MVEKCFFKWVVWKRPIEKKHFKLSCFKFYLNGVQNAFKIFYKSLKNLVQKFATICIWKQSTFGFELELSLISKQNLKEKVWVDFKSGFVKEVFQNGLKGLKNIWFDLIPQKSYSKKNLNMCIKSFVWLQKKMGIENLPSSFLK